MATSNDPASVPARIDWRGANLRGANLNHMVLDYADMRGADLRDVNFTHSSLRYADFRGANIQGANFQYASLYAAKMQGVEANNADFRNADLRMVNWGGAYVQGSLTDLRAATRNPDHPAANASTPPADIFARNGHQPAQETPPAVADGKAPTPPPEQPRRRR